LILDLFEDGSIARYVADTGQIDLTDETEDPDRLQNMYGAIAETIRALRKQRKPGDPPGQETENDDLAEAFLIFISVNYSQKDIKDRLVEHFHYGPKYFAEIIHKKTGLNLTEHIRRLRLKEAGRLLSTTGLTIQEVADRVGYNSASGFAKVYRKYYNKAPGSARKRGRKDDSFT